MSNLPFILEDSTGRVAGSDFDDIYDRIFLRVAPGAHQRGSSLMIYKMAQRSSRRRDSLPFRSAPSILLEFGAGGALGNISFLDRKNPIPLHMGRYLRKASMFGGSLFRKFVAADGREYKWSCRTVPGQEWSCHTEDGFLVAHYNLKQPEERVYDVSGNVLTVYEQFTHLSLEILASLTIMRHIAEYNL